MDSFLAVSFSTVLDTLLAGMARIDVRDDRCTVPIFSCGLVTLGTDAFDADSLRTVLSPSLLVADAVFAALFTFPFVSTDPAAELFDGTVAAAVAEPLTVFVTLEAAKS